MNSTRLVAAGFLPFALAGCLHTPSGVDDLRCADRKGLDGPLVAQELTALAIAGAVISANALQPNEEVRYELAVEDKGDHWVVYEHTPPKQHKDGASTMQFGGGYAVEIDKCDGRIRSLRPQR